MSTHSSILAWEIPWTEEPGGLQSMGSQGAKQNRATQHHHHHFKEGKSELPGSPFNSEMSWNLWEAPSVTLTHGGKWREISPSMRLWAL